MHLECQMWLIKVSALYQPKKVLELGSCDVNGAVKNAFPTATEWVGVDIAEGPGVDIVANAATYRGEPDSYDLVVSASTFEHTPEWPQIVKTAAWHCKPGGHAAFTTVMAPFPPHSARDGKLLPGEWYSDVCPGPLKNAMQTAGFVGVHVGTTPKGDVFAVGTRA